MGRLLIEEEIPLCERVLSVPPFWQTVHAQLADFDIASSERVERQDANGNPAPAVHVVINHRGRRITVALDLYTLGFQAAGARHHNVDLPADPSLYNALDIGRARFESEPDGTEGDIAYTVHDTPDGEVLGDFTMQTRRVGVPADVAIADISGPVVRRVMSALITAADKHLVGKRPAAIPSMLGSHRDVA